MDLSNLERPENANKKRRRVGRGEGSTLGKTCGKGQKGQKSRAGGSIPVWFEGGQMPLQMRVPKSGFSSPNRTDVVALNLSELERVFESGDTVTIEALAEAGVVKLRPQRFAGGEIRQVLKGDALKILGNGELSKALTVHAHRFSKGAIAKIEAAGGTVVVIGAESNDEQADEA